MGEAWSAPADLDAIRESLLTWYEKHRRSLPWRGISDPYRIMVAEVMSQQTQLDRVIDPYNAFIERWPTAAALSAAEQSAVVAFWSNHALGYNSRARYLCEAATMVVEEWDGTFPESPAELQELPGVGPYTANAIASFAFNAGDAVVDTNVKRVLYRAFGVPDDRKTFERAANTLLPPEKSGIWNNAIMELGGLACEPTPRCDERACPWRQWCGAYRTGDFTAPDVPSQPSFDGSRRQYRGRIVRALAADGPMTPGELGPRIRVDYGSDGAGWSWLLDILADLEAEGLVTVEEAPEPRVTLAE